ncbi:cob(I)yrinic acid a,c-diamide adenosyltransferase [bacterium]|nr:cob(I)yrinic acid a,c-diamide adenosyltransferase [bacterium]
MLHVYTGDGKGKTTAALGLAVRAAAAGLPVAIIYFDKGFDGENEHYSERKLLRALPGVTLFPTGCERIMQNGRFRFGVRPEDRAEAVRALTLCEDVLRSRRYRLVVIDEICSALTYKLIQLDELMRIVEVYREVGGDVELVMTGRGAPQELIQAADLVTEMKQVKHYYETGVMAREGIDY